MRYLPGGKIPDTEEDNARALEVKKGRKEKRPERALVQADYYRYDEKKSAGGTLSEGEKAGGHL